MPPTWGSMLEERLAGDVTPQPKASLGHPGMVSRMKKDWARPRGQCPPMLGCIKNLRAGAALAPKTLILICI